MDHTWSKRDRWLAAAIFVSATFGGVTATNAYVAAGSPPFFYQAEFGPAVLAACGRGFQNPPDLLADPGLEALWAFLLEKTPSFDCATLPTSIAARPFNAFQRAHRYLIQSASGVWRVTGVAWPQLAWLGGVFMGTTAAAAYLFFRAATGAFLALTLTGLWATSPLHLAQVPHLRDYAKTPFFAVMLCAVIWASRTRAKPAVTIAVMAGLGAWFGLGFGVRTDVALYLPVVIVALLFTSPRTRTEMAARAVAAIASLALFVGVSAPVLRDYQLGNNLAHVAILGLTDSSREWLGLQPAPYSFGYRYEDGYVATIIDAEAEREGELATPITYGSADYAVWGNRHYRRLQRTFPGDMLTRSWAAVRGAIGLPFIPIQLQRPSWSTGAAGQLFDWRGAVVAKIAMVPPVLAAIAALVMLGSVNWRLALLAASVWAFLAGTTAVQFQGRHIFQLEILSWCALGFVGVTTWRLLRGAYPLAAYPGLLKRAGVLAIALVVVVAAPIAAARRYQVAQVTQLFSEYDAAATEAVQSEVVAAQRDSDVLVRITGSTAAHSRRFVDSDLLAVSFGGELCDADVVGVTFRYQSKPPYPDLTRHTQLPMPPPGTQRTRILFPIYSTGGRMTDPEAMTFSGVELAKAQQSCLVELRRVTKPEALPIFMETVLVPDWRRGPLYEAFRGVEPESASWRFNSFAIPENLQPGRRWLAQIEAMNLTPTFRSRQVTALGANRIESSGRAADAGAYLLTWPYQSRASGSAFFVEGEIVDGGLTIGLQQNERWAHQLNVDTKGAFRAVIRVDEEGSYGAILANHQVGGQRHRSVITRYGWLPPAP